MVDTAVERRGASSPEGERAAPTDIEGFDTAAAVRRLAAATQRLALTIRATEELAGSRAELLRTAATTVAIDGSFGRRRQGVLSLHEAAKRSGRHPEVLRRWCRDGRIPAIRVGRTWAVTTETLATLMEHRSRSRPRLDRRSA